VQKIYLRQLKLTHYRNYQTLKQEFSFRSVVLTGHNGAGKTNLLEAISLLSPGRGLRRASYADIPSVSAEGQSKASVLSAVNSGSFSVSAVIESSLYGETELGANFVSPGSAAGNAKAEAIGRRALINGTAQPAENLSEYCRIIWLIPAQDGLFTGAAGDRRRFLDRMTLALDAAHARRVIDYEKVMRSRNRLLADGAADTYFLDALEMQMAALGTAIAAARLELVARLSSAVMPLSGEYSFPQAVLKMEGFPENRLQHEAAVDVEENFLLSLRENRDKDHLAGRSLIGPHRSDLLVFHKEKNMAAALCSTGEQKALLTGLILTHARLTAELSGMTPILLLDEIAAHLDEKRRAALFSILEDLQTQAFMTGTDKTLFSALEGKADFFRVEEGHLLPQNG